MRPSRRHRPSRRTPRTTRSSATRRTDIGAHRDADLRQNATVAVGSSLRRRGFTWLSPVAVVALVAAGAVIGVQDGLGIAAQISAGRQRGRADDACPGSGDRADRSNAAAGGQPIDADPPVRRPGRCAPTCQGPRSSGLVRGLAGNHRRDQRDRPHCPFRDGRRSRGGDSPRKPSEPGAVSATQSGSLVPARTESPVAAERRRSRSRTAGCEPSGDACADSRHRGPRSSSRTGIDGLFQTSCAELSHRLGRNDLGAANDAVESLAPGGAGLASLSDDELAALEDALRRLGPPLRPALRFYRSLVDCLEHLHPDVQLPPRHRDPFGL